MVINCETIECLKNDLDMTTQYYWNSITNVLYLCFQPYDRISETITNGMVALIFHHIMISNKRYGVYFENEGANENIIISNIICVNVFVAHISRSHL